jgi:hypothetical protein
MQVNSQAIDENLTAAERESNIKIVAQTPYAVTTRDGSQKLWSKTSWESNLLTGEITLKTNSYVELTPTSAHFVSGQWVESSDQIQITSFGAHATNSQHKVEFLGNINTAGSIRLRLPEGDKSLVSTPIGLSYFDTESGKSVLIAEVKDAIGQLLPSGNQVLYPNAFTDISADALYINAASGFEQLIVLRDQPPSPAEWGLNPETTVLQVITEFLDPPAPRITSRYLDGLIDEHLDFGITQMPKGYAFALGNETNTIPVTKQWLLLDGRHCLVESTPFKQLAPLLKELPPRAGQAARQKSPNSAIYKVAKDPLLPARKLGTGTTTSLLLANSTLLAKGVAIDYSTVSSQTNFTFQGNTTYYVSSNITLSGTTTIEGGAVIKFTNNPNAKLSMSGSGVLVCKTGPYRPAVLTSKDDNTVGEVISGSTGSPTNFNGGTYLNEPWANTTYEYLRFAYAGIAIHAFAPEEVKHCQFFCCSTAISGDDNTELKLRNVLFSLCGTAVSIDSGNSLVGEHVTADQLTTFFNAPFCTANLTNSILTAVATIGANVNLYYSTTNSSGNGIYQTVGAGGYYLADNSTNRDTGTTIINTNLLNDFKTKTTHPPLLWTSDFTSNTNLSPQAVRDSNTPDRGYHYDPLDYVLTGRAVTNSTLTLTNGVAIGTYGVGGSQGFYIRKNGNLVSVGLPNNLNQIVRYNTVQEQSSTNWSASSAAPSIRISADTATSPKGSFRFTGWSLLGGNGFHFYADYPNITTPFGFMDCQFGPGGFTSIQCSIALTNCLLERPNISLEDDGGNYAYYGFNNLFRFGNVILSRSGSASWLFKDNLFDRSTISTSGTLTHSNNAYVTGYSRLSPTNASDVVLTNIPIYLKSYLGNCYYPTNGGLLSTLINAGSRSATNALLYHYCTTTNQVKESSSTVDIGFHYVATDSNGNPIDTDGDGIADYLADTNGNGFQEFGELTFGITVENPVNGSVLNK